MRIDAREDRCLIVEGTTVAVASVGVQDDTERVRVPVHCHTWKPMGKTVGPCVVVLCVDMDTVHGCCKTTGLSLFCSKKFAAREVQSETKRLRKRKRTK